MIALEARGAFLKRVVRELAPPSSVPDLSGVEPAARERARRAWAQRLVDEYRSIVVFSELLHLLSRIEAPLPALVATQRLLGDELRHVALCARVVEWLGGFEGLAIDLEDMALPPSDRSPAARALEIVVRELVVAEGESLIALKAYRDATTVPEIREVLATLVREEATHLAAGEELEPIVRALVPAGEVASLVAELEATAAADRAWIRAGHVRGARGGPGRALGVSIAPGELVFTT